MAAYIRMNAWNVPTNPVQLALIIALMQSVHATEVIY